MVGNGWVRHILCVGLLFSLHLTRTRSIGATFYGTERYPVVKSDKLDAGEGWWDLSDGPSRGMVEMLAAQPLGPLGSRHNLSKS
jgi:hypothetical protein